MPIFTPIQRRIDRLRYEIAGIDDEQGINEANGDWDDDLQCQRSDYELELRELTGEEYDFKPPTLEECEKALGEPASEWVTRCHEIACLLIDKLKLPGQSQYGFYYGPIVEGSVFYPRPLARHGWVLLNDKRIFDPTRWCFDSPKTPYIFCLHPEWCEREEYDFGMNRYREANLRPPPGTEIDPTDRIVLSMETTARDFVRDLFNEILLQEEFASTGDNVIALTKAQVFWLSNYPYHRFGELAETVYRAIEAADLAEFIPIDNRNAVGIG